MSNRKMLLSICVVVHLMPTQIAAQKGQSLVGSIVEAHSSSPVADVTVTLFRRDTSKSVATTSSNENGKFVFAGLSVGEYGLILDKTGYLTERASVSAFRRGALFVPVRITGVGDTETIEVKLLRAARVSGRITDDAGSPAHAKVMLSSIPSSENDMPMTATARTGPNGEYRFEGIRPGRYLISADALWENSARRDLPPRLKSLRTFYPGVPNEASASAISLDVGDVWAGLDIALINNARYSVTGVAYGSSEAVRLRLFSPELGLMRNAVARSDGVFDFKDLPRARYVLEALGRSRTGQPLVAWRVLDLPDFAPLELMLAPGAIARGRVIGLAAPSALRLSFVLLDTIGEVEIMSGGETTINSDGSFTVEMLYGLRRIELKGLPPLCALRSIEGSRGRIQGDAIAFNASEILDPVTLTVRCQ